ncbi:MAG: hypothetical protein QF357_01870 [Dehalococcoidia bacterium]|jgi:uncharacterized membrane protein|nr:hypothetical protein [Dehalococcoidia bacterium]
MSEYAFARVIHVLGVVLWIGGVAMVTTVLLPAMKRMKPGEEPITLFERLESRFAFQAKIATVLTGLSGFYMLDYIDGWSRYSDPKFWWLHAMTIVWAIFTLVLFVLEPLVLSRMYKEHGARNPTKTLAVVHRLHLVLLVVSLLTIAGAVAGSHGWFVF